MNLIYQICPKKLVTLEFQIELKWDVFPRKNKKRETLDA